MSLDNLIEKCKKGDTAAFSVLVTEYENKILNHCFRMLGNTSDAEDATQEVFVKVYRFIDTFSNKASFSTWIYKIATNVCLDMLRKNKHKNEDTSFFTKQSKEGEEYEQEPVDTGPTPYEATQQKLAQEALFKALSSMKDEQKNMIVLRDVEGFSYEEIAEITGLSLGTVKSRINRARAVLKNLLEKDRELFMG